ncbi:hypothetical protein ECZU36_00020 [Escherichia coli]|nr:hypothetical protein ECZU36_00020 [Escherichia coli]
MNARKTWAVPVIPIKGASVYGKPVASMPRKRKKTGLLEIGTDTAKEQIYNRFTTGRKMNRFPVPFTSNNPDILI